MRGEELPEEEEEEDEHYETVNNGEAAELGLD